MKQLGPRQDEFMLKPHFPPAGISEHLDLLVLRGGEWHTRRWWMLTYGEISDRMGINVLHISLQKWNLAGVA
jgi:hypothetical protein